MSRADTIETWEELDDYLDDLMEGRVVIEPIEVRYRKFVDSKQWKCVVCQEKKPGKQIESVLSFLDVGTIAICRLCRPSCTDNHARQLMLFGTKDSSRMYWMIGPNPPQDSLKDPPSKPEEAIPLSETGISPERYQKFLDENQRREDSQRRRDGSFDRKAGGRGRR